MNMDKENDFELTDELLEKINCFTRNPLTAEQVYAFPVILCDNEIDRDNERFSIEALIKLAELFIGKTGIFDHDPKGKNQTARIFDTEIKFYADRVTSAGEPYTCLVGKAYMVRTSSSEDLIKEIEGGIKKEVSISCSVMHKYCSICRADRMDTACVHTKGQKYNDKVCTFILDEPTDAYEWSFVVPPVGKMNENIGVKKMTKAEAIEILNQMLSECKEDDKRVALALATAIFEVKNEPAPAEADTSSGTQNILHLHDSTESIICQALKYGKMAAETGATITHSDGVFIVAPRVGEQP